MTDNIEKKDSKRIYLYIIGILILAVLVMIVWKNLAVKSVEKRMEAQQTKLVEVTQQIITNKTYDFLRLTTIPLIWAIRKEMIVDNYSQINEYLVQFVKQPGVKQIFVVKADGKIIVATDKKLEGADFVTFFPKELLEQNDVTMSNDNSGNIQLSAPIMGLNSKLGILMMVYEPEKVMIEVNR